MQLIQRRYIQQYAVLTFLNCWK